MRSDGDGGGSDGDGGISCDVLEIVYCCLSMLCETKNIHTIKVIKSSRMAGKSPTF